MMGTLKINILKKIEKKLARHYKLMQVCKKKIKT
jgi:hypothetical protein